MIGKPSALIKRAKAFLIQGGAGVIDSIQNPNSAKILMDIAPTIIGARTPEGILTYINDYWYIFTGCPAVEDVADINWRYYIHPDDLPKLEFSTKVGFEIELEFVTEFRIRRADGEYRWFRSIAQPVHSDRDDSVVQWLTVTMPIHDLKEAQEEVRQAKLKLEKAVADRTAELEESNERLLQEMDERQQTQDALRQAQKMESVGQLTGGIAHDFNNMLQVIIGNLELMKMNAVNLGENPVAARMERNVNMAIEAALKAEKLTSQLLAFSRKSKLQPARLDVNEIIVGVRDIVDRAVGKGITVGVDLQDDVWLCLSDKTQLESAIVNLAINARDAMPSGGKLTICSSNRTINDARFVSVCVSDTGTGMTKEVLEKVFEPFYTTKDVGKGSGLGLSMVYGFCQQSNGRVHIESEPGKGTTVEMLFPYTGGTSIEETKAEEDFNYDSNKQSILVVDDEPGVRELACQLLSDLGYNVVSADNGEAAIQIIRDQTIPLDLLFTDVVMPGGIDGFGVAAVANFERPHMPVLFTTGHAEVALKELKKDLKQKIKVIGKPYRLNDLGQQIGNVLKR